MTTYPARIGFQLKEPRRSRVLAAATRLGLTIQDLNTEGFVIVVPNADTAYALGRASAAPSQEEDTP
jgi:hypothetical protein